MTGPRWVFRRGLAGAGLTLVALCMAAAPVFAQAQYPVPPEQNPSLGGGKPPVPVVGGFENLKALPPGGSAPRMTDGHVDMSGLWYPNNAGRMLEGAYPVDRNVFRQFDPKVTPEPPLVFKPGMAEKYKSPVPYGTCDQAGTPSSITMQENQHGPIWITQKPGMFIIMIEYPLTVRMIHTDARPHAKDPDPTFNGDSTAHWDGDTLVVDVTGMNDQTWFDRAGDYHSNDLHVVERYTLKSPEILEYEATIEDPQVFSRAWKITVPLYRHVEKNFQLMEYKCVPFAEEVLYGPYRRHAAAGAK